MRKNLISYIAPSAPATRRPAAGDEWFLRPEIGFTPNWYHQILGIDFGEKWHTDPRYRYKTILEMREELRRRFPGTRIGRTDEPDFPPDLLTGVYGACSIAAIYGIPIIYSKNNWPVSAHKFLNDREADSLVSPGLDENPHFQELMSQADQIQAIAGKIEGFINWQGVLNNAHRLRGQELFTDMMINPERALRIFDCVSNTMIEAAERLQKRQMDTGVEVGFITLSNCLVNMVSPEEYAAMLLPFDQRIAAVFRIAGVHNCAWNANPYLESYRRIREIGYLDMGIESDLAKAKSLFPDTRRAIMYTPMDLANKSMKQLKSDAVQIAMDYGPCDIVVADIEAGTPDEKIGAFYQICREISIKSPQLLNPEDFGSS